MIKIEYVDIDTLIPYINNAKIHTDKQIKQIAKSIKQFGMNDPIAIWRDNTIIEGHGRLLACQSLGIKSVPIIRLDDLTDEQRRAYTLIHNKLTMNTDFDIDLLNTELTDIKDIDMSEFDFDLSFADVEEPADETTDETEWDIDKLDKHYGVPYQGNKSRIADIIINILPAGNRLVDLFGGGGV